MFWIALSALIMTLTGAGDDTYVIRKFIAHARESVAAHVDDEARKRAATTTLDDASRAFEKHRLRVGKISECVAKLDRRYAATQTEYERCLTDVAPAWDAAAEDLIVLDARLRESLAPPELAAIMSDTDPR